jgi:hypothetical protein
MGVCDVCLAAFASMEALSPEEAGPKIGAIGAESAFRVAESKALARISS